MRFLAGLAYHDRSRPVEADVLLGLAARGGAVGTACAETADGFGIVHDGVLAATGRKSRLLVAGDLQLTNLPELRQLTGEADAVAIVRTLYGREGVGAFRHLRGGFAVVVWDAERREVVLAVDHFGIKRLLYAPGATALVFGTRSTALVGPPGVDGRVDPSAVYHYLNFGYVPTPLSVFTGVRRLPPGHTLRARGSDTTVGPFWDLAYREERVPEGEAARATYRMVEEAVGRSLRDVNLKEVGAFLSGGTDSSTVVGLMSRLTDERVNAFSIGFQEPHYDELHYATLVARHFGVAHHTAVVTPDEALHALPGIIRAYDEPFGNNSAIGTYLCARVARASGMTRLLAGDGGDEIFAGNERYAADRVFARYHLIPAALRRFLIEPVAATLPAGQSRLVHRAQRYIRRAKLSTPRRFYSYSFYFAQDGRQLLDPAFLAALDLEGPWNLLEDRFRSVEAQSDLNRLLYLDMKLTIGDNDLLKVTRTAELAGLDVEFPMLDLDLVSFTTTIPARFKLRGLEKRYLFKRAFRSLLPPEVLDKRKHGFGVPTSTWLKTHAGFRALVRDTLGSGRARQRGYLRPDAAERLLNLHENDETAFYGDILWTVLALELWFQRTMEAMPA